MIAGATQERTAARARFERERAIYLELRKLWKLDPERYCHQRLGLHPTWQQKKVLDAIKEPGSKVSVRSGHGIGKDAIAAGIILWFIETHDYSRCACTAPSAHQLRDILWGELAKWMRRSDRISIRHIDHPVTRMRNLFKLNQNTLHDQGAPLEWYAIARTARKENPEALQGLHASDVDIDESGESATKLGDASLLFVVDEASGVDDVVFEVAEGALSSPDSRVLMIGNATRNTGYFAASHKHRRQEYTCLHFKSSESPLVDADFRDGLVRRFGEDSNVVRVRADGEFPKQDDDTLISVEDTEMALSRDYDP
jgi:phage terminase large subunit